MNLDTLKFHLKQVLPILDANLAAAHTEYLTGDLAAGAYHYVLSRHAIAVLSLDNGLKVEDAYKACAPLAIDLRSGISLMPNQDEAKQHVAAWWQCYREAGFTEVQPLFNWPALPVTESSLIDKPEAAAVDQTKDRASAV